MKLTTSILCTLCTLNVYMYTLVPALPTSRPAAGATSPIMIIIMYYAMMYYAIM